MTLGILTSEMQKRVMDAALPSITVEVDRSLIRDFAEAIGDPNPLWNDDAAARRTRYGGLIAPPTFPRVLTFIAGGQSATRWELPGTVQVDGGTEWELIEPIRPGDRITVIRRVKGVSDRQGRAGPLIFIRVETQFVNQFGTLVCVQLSTAIRYTPHSDASSKPSSPERPEGSSNGNSARPSIAKLDWASVGAGAELPLLRKCPSTRDLVRYAGASKDYSEIHYDDAFARRVGLPGVIVHGGLKAAYLGQLITDWIGDFGTLKRLECQHRGINRPGETLTCRGEVSRTYELRGNQVVECEIWLENSLKDRSAPGRATVEFANPSPPHGIRDKTSPDLSS